MALDLGDPVLAPRRAVATRERERLTDALHGTSLPSRHRRPVRVADSETHDGTAIAQHLGVRRILVVRGDRWGDERHVRITLRDADATDRLIAGAARAGVNVNGLH